MSVKLYLVQNVSAGFVGNSPVFWHASNSGYTQWVDEARLFTWEEASRQVESTRGSHEWKMWSENKIQSVKKYTVDIQDLRK